MSETNAEILTANLTRLKEQAGRRPWPDLLDDLVRLTFGAIDAVKEHDRAGPMVPESKHRALAEEHKTTLDELARAKANLEMDSE